MSRRDSAGANVHLMQIAQQHHSASDEDDYDFAWEEDRTRAGIGGRIAALLSMRRRQRPGSNIPPPGNVNPKEGSRASSRSRRKSYLSRLVRRTLLLFPVAVLSGFGVLHILQALISPNSIFLNHPDEDFMPEFGKPGKLGADLSTYPTDVTKGVLPVPCHSHNDYWRRVPLFEALHWGCTSVEADVWLYDQELYVGHSKRSLTANRTLQNMYVKPLVEMLDRRNPSTEFTNANSSINGIFDEKPEQSTVLLIDLETSGLETFAAVSAQLAPLREKNYLTYYNGSVLIPGPITVVGTGNTPFSAITANTTHRDIFFDAPLASLSSPTPPSPSDKSVYNPTNSFYASTSFTQILGFIWFGKPSTSQLERLRKVHAEAHEAGLKVRWWDTPSWPKSKRNAIWELLVREGADVLSVDDLRGAVEGKWRKRVGGWLE